MNLILPIIFILGLCIGSFLNVIILRMKEKKSFVIGRSYCPKCRHQLFYYDNIPLVSFMLLGGKCRYCHKKISAQYFLVEIFTALMFSLAYIVWRAQSGSLLLLFSYLFFISILTIIFVYDLRWYLILDKVSIPAIILAFILNVALGYSPLNLLLAAGVVGGFFLLQFAVSKGKWIGGGDIRLGVLMGVMLGWPNAIAALFISYIIGSVFCIFLIALKKKKMKSKIPFGTFLSIGAVIVLLYGSQIVQWYMGMLR